MATVWQASVEDLYQVNGKAELVGGELRMMSPASGRHGRATLVIAASLMQMEKTLKGFAFCDNVGFLVNLPNRRSFSPDAAFFMGAVPEEEFLNQAPVFAVEIRSPSDYGPAAEQRLAVKRDEYFAAGTQVVWDVDLRGDDVVQVYRQSEPTNPQIYRRDEVAETEPAVPGWTFPVSDLFK
jgi:Uma2 family endonuclease